jgi:hypothetical protein
MPTAVLACGTGKKEKTMKTTVTYHIWPRDLCWSEKIAAIEATTVKRGYMRSDVMLGDFAVEENRFRRHNADTSDEFIELLRRFPQFVSFSYRGYFAKAKSSMPDPTVQISHESDRVSVLVDSRNADLIAGLHTEIADQCGLQNPRLPAGESSRAKHLQPTVFVGRHFDAEGKAAFSPLCDFLTLLAFEVLQGEEYSSRDIPDKVQARIDSQDIFIGLVTGKRNHAWLNAEPAYAKGRDRHIIMLVEDGSDYDPAILGKDLEQIRFPANQVERAFNSLLRELRNIRVKGL